MQIICICAKLSPMDSHCTAEITKKIKVIEEMLKSATLKVTRPRRAVLRLLVEKGAPLTIEQIHRSLKRNECDRVTIYRTVSALEKAGLAQRCDLGDGLARFEFTEKHAKNHHHHVICRKCNRIEHLDLCIEGNWQQALAQRGFSDISHQLEFAGLCSTCGVAR